MVSIIIKRLTSLALMYFAPFPNKTLEIGLINNPITITIIKVLKSISSSSQKKKAIALNDNPLKAVIKIDDRYTLPKLEEIEYNMERIIKVKNGLEEPVSCGQCDYCRSVNKVTRILTIDEL